MPTGPFPPNPSELLASINFKQLLSKLSEEYDYIFLDCPPVIGLDDALVVSSIADTTIIVAKHKSTSYDLLESALSSLKGINANISGIIINQIEKKEQKSYYNHYYNSYSDKYYKS